MPDLSYVLDFDNFVDDFKEAQAAIRRNPTMPSIPTIPCEKSLTPTEIIDHHSLNLEKLSESTLAPISHAFEIQKTVPPLIEAIYAHTSHVPSAEVDVGHQPSNMSISPSTTQLLRQPRKGYKKSREGCFNCKRRKIKVHKLL